LLHLTSINSCIVQYKILDLVATIDFMENLKPFTEMTVTHVIRWNILIGITIQITSIKE